MSYAYVISAFVGNVRRETAKNGRKYIRSDDDEKSLQILIEIRKLFTYLLR
jgi:hypothetical protein